MQPRDLSAHEPYQAGRGIEEVARELSMDPGDLIKLASNENPHGPSPKAADAIRQAAASANHYPTAAHTDLTEKLATRWDVSTEQIWLANGGDGALDYLARALLEPGDEVLVSDPGFAYYAMSARYHHGRVNTYSLSPADGFQQTPETVLSAYDGERIVYLTSPHNPSGSTVPLSDVREIAAGTDDETLVLVDEAYGEYTDAPDAVELVRERDDVASLRTFSKAYGLAGARLGYAVVPDEWADVYAKVNTPFAASELACRAGIAALDDDAHVEKSVETARWAREYMREEVDAHVYDGEANFVLVEVGDGTETYEALKREGVIVRDTTSYGIPDCVRVTCGTESETRAAVAAINEVLAR